ncbi:hypothetical protein WME97_20710 [Sorangium sp. So ce367]
MAPAGPRDVDREQERTPDGAEAPSREEATGGRPPRAAQRQP